jgi:hypothetical protein
MVPQQLEQAFVQFLRIQVVHAHPANAADVCHSFEELRERALALDVPTVGDRIL